MFAYLYLNNITLPTILYYFFQYFVIFFLPVFPYNLIIYLTPSYYPSYRVPKLWTSTMHRLTKGNKL